MTVPAIPTPVLLDTEGKTAISASTLDTHVTFTTDTGSMYELWFSPSDRGAPALRRVPIQRAVGVRISEGHSLTAVMAATRPSEIQVDASTLQQEFSGVCSFYICKPVPIISMNT